MIKLRENLSRKYREVMFLTLIAFVYAFVVFICPPFKVGVNHALAITEQYTFKIEHIEFIFMFFVFSLALSLISLD